MRVPWVLVVCLFAAACDRGAGKGAAPTCDDVTSVLVKATGIAKDKDTPATHAALTARCKDDHWPDEARTCFAKVTTTKNIHACEHDTLTGAQSDKLNAALPSSFEEAMRKMQEFTDKMCACKDAKCAQVVSDEMTKWSQEMAKEQQEPPRMTEEDTKRASEIGMRMGECMQKAMGVDIQPQQPPNEPGPPVEEGAQGGNGNIIDKAM